MLVIRPATFAVIVVSLMFAPRIQAGDVITFDAPGVQTSSAIDTSTINFDSASNGWHYTETFNPSNSLTATYVGNQFVDSANQYGGAGGTGNYLAVQANNSVTISLSTPQAYFGLWFSAADPSNEIELYNGNTSWHH